jgi:hypothetical protein
MIRVITTFSDVYWEKVGQYSIPTWPTFMPADWELWFHDTPTVLVKPTRTLSSTEKLPWMDAAANYSSGRELPPGYQSQWGMFCHKSFAQWECYKEQPTGIMIWCDADVKWLKTPSKELIDHCLQGGFCGYLGRDRVDGTITKKANKYSRFTAETCIVVYDLDHPIAKEYFAKVEETYKSMELFDLFSWCDASVFEHVKSQFPAEYFNDIGKNDPAAVAPLPFSILGEYFEHWMGWTNKEARDDLSGKKEKSRFDKRNK